jgi:hypothetical protein
LAQLAHAPLAQVFGPLSFDRVDDRRRDRNRGDGMLGDADQPGSCVGGSGTRWT